MSYSRIITSVFCILSSTPVVPYTHQSIIRTQREFIYHRIDIVDTRGPSDETGTNAHGFEAASHLVRINSTRLIIGCRSEKRPPIPSSSTKPRCPLFRLPIDSSSNCLRNLPIRLLRRMQFIPPMSNHPRSQNSTSNQGRRTKGSCLDHSRQLPYSSHQTLWPHSTGRRKRARHQSCSVARCR